MKERIQGILVGILISTIGLGCVAYATSATKTIDVLYNNIKVYKDNVLCELKDANGTPIEPFIYNGTTYMPVRGTANLANMQVTWDGNTNSVYLWDEISPASTYLMEVCPPYEGNYDDYLQNNGDSFEMAGEKYSNGLVLARTQTYIGSALFNLNGKYSTLECTIGHVYSSDYDQSVSFIVDGKLVEEVSIPAGEMPKTVSIPLNNGLQLKIIRNNGGTYQYIGLGNIIVK